VNILRSFLPSNPEPEAAPAVVAPPVGKVLLVGEEYDWLPDDAMLAGRKVVRIRTKEDAVALLKAEPIEGLIAALPEIGKNLALLNTAMSVQPAIACGLRAEVARTDKLMLTNPVIPATKSQEVLDDLTRTMFATARWNADPAFTNLKSQIARVPALPTLYSQITAALQDEDTSIDDVADLIACEPAVTAKLLQVVNSPIFALRQRVTSIRDAAGYLGVLRLRALVLSTSLIGQCDTSRCHPFIPEAFESHSLKIADWSARITVGETRDRKLGELAFTAGLLHQFGTLLLATNLPDIYAQVLQASSSQRVSLARVERRAFGVTHAELAAFLLASWNIPFAIVSAVGFHTQPSLSGEKTFSPLTAVHMATAIDLQATTGEVEYDQAYLDSLRLMPRYDQWAQAFAEEKQAAA
jgi:HD-like signal output (HDOD) protein